MQFAQVWLVVSKAYFKCTISNICNLLVSDAATMVPDNSSQNFPITTPEPLQCQEDFFREKEKEGGACVPSCYTWKEYSEAVTVITDLAIGLTSVIGFIFCLAVIIISCIRFDRM